MGTFGHDIRFALRSLRRGALVNTVAAVSLAFAIGGNTTVFSLINAILYRPLPYPEPERVYVIGEREANAPQTLTMSPANFNDLAERNRALSAVAGFRPGAATVGLGDRPISVPSASVTPGFFELLGAQLVRGRGFVPDEGTPGRDRVVVVTEGFRDDRLAGAAGDVGAELMVNGAPHTIVGILPDDFEFFFPGMLIWKPLTVDPVSLSRDERTVIGVGRIREGVTDEQARDDLQRIWSELVAEHPDANEGFILDVSNLRYEIPNNQGRAMFAFLQATVLFVLLIACVNIGNLLTARGQAREREIALRTILGAKRRRIVRQLLVETSMLALFAGAIGVLLAWAAVRVMGTQFAGIVPSYYVPAMDPPVLLGSLIITLATGLLFGVAPTLQSLRVDLASTMKEGGRGVTGNARRKLMSRALVVAEIALSLILLGGASMMVQSFTGFRAADLGFDDDSLLTVPVTLPADPSVSRSELVEQVRSRVDAMPGVVDVTSATSLPQNAFPVSAVFSVAGRERARGETQPRAIWLAVTPDYASALKVAVLRGRFVTDADREDAAPVVVINNALAERYFPDEDPLGQRLEFRGVSREIVGVVADTRQTIVATTGQGADNVLMMPFAQQVQGAYFVLARTSVDPDGVAAPLRAELQTLHPQLVVGRIQTLDEMVDQLFVGIDLFNLVLTTFGNLALILAAVGTYGVLAYNVSQRSQEIGVRMALGAQRGEVVRMITRQGVVLGIIGLIVGAPGVIGVVRLLEFIVAGTTQVEIGTVFGVAAVLLGATALAGFIPALRAARTDPVVVLRHE